MSEQTPSVAILLRKSPRTCHNISRQPPRLFHSIETLDKKATPLDTKFFHSNGPNYDPSNTSVLVDGPFCTDRFDTVPALSMYSFYDVYWY